MMGSDWEFGGVWIGGIVVGWIIVIGVGAWIVMALTRSHADSVSPGRAETDILDRRLAAGEIDLDQYHDLMRSLRDCPR